MPLKLYNTLGRQLQQFQPLEEGRAGLYACGPTVYNYAHIGNLRAYVFEDILRRTLEMEGYEVSHVMNVTDVGHLTDDGDEGEDKMIKSSREQGMSVWDIARFFTDAFFRDTERLNIRRPTVVCRATEHIRDMIRLIQRLEGRGYTYQAGGNLYFDVSRFENYGEMALLDRQDLQHGARIAVDENKRNPQDFVLWFTQSKFEHQAMVWDSPWGRGYPGWHLECSAMSMRYLGEQFDIHCGGIDHVPVHHTNEIAQSEGATGKKWVNYWLHNEFLIMQNGKMSKSKGGFLTLQALVDEGYDPLDYRYFLLGGHYRSQLVFSWDSLDAARRARANLNSRMAQLGREVFPGEDFSDKDEAAAALGRACRIPFDSSMEPWMDRFREALEEDLNTPRALAALWTAVKSRDLSAGQRLSLALAMDDVLGLGLADRAAEGLAVGGETPGAEDLPEGLEDLIREREQARKERNFQRADEIRDQLAEQGITLVDAPGGTEWKKNDA